MPILLCSEPPPLTNDGTGALRVGDSRVLFELVIRAFQDGATAEAIVQRYSSLSLAEAYASIAYYLRHREVVEQYLEEREQQAELTRQRIETRQPDLTEIRSRILSKSSS